MLVTFVTLNRRGIKDMFDSYCFVGWISSLIDTQIFIKMRFLYNHKQRYQSIPQTTRLVTISALS